MSSIRHQVNGKYRIHAIDCGDNVGAFHCGYRDKLNDQFVVVTEAQVRFAKT